MFDTMTLTKIGGALCGALLVFLLGNWAAEIVYSTESDGHGDEVAQAYVIDTGADEEAGGAEEEGPDFATLLASADVDAGSKVFNKCIWTEWWVALSMRLTVTPTPGRWQRLRTSGRQRTSTASWSARKGSRREPRCLSPVFARPRIAPTW